ncbi:hypothetical protein ACO0RG_002720 [Hanseniaspora osmophila]
MKEVVLVSRNGEEFPISTELAKISPIIKADIEMSTSKPNKPVVIELKEIESNVLSKVIEYLKYKYEYTKNDDEYNEDADDIPAFDIPVDMSLDLLIAADYLNI